MLKLSQAYPLRRSFSEASARGIFSNASSGVEISPTRFDSESRRERKNRFPSLDLCPKEFREGGSNNLFFSFSDKGDPFFDDLEDEFKGGFDEEVENKNKKVQSSDFLAEKFTNGENRHKEKVSNWAKN